MRRLAAPFAVGLAVALLGACAARKPGTETIGQSQLENLVRTRGLAPTHAIVPYRLTAEMKRWLDDRVATSVVDPKDRLLALSRALFLDGGALGIEYVREHTGTASEVFETRRANCLAFTHMFVGMARYLDIPAYFLEVRNVVNYRREGDLIVVSDHVAVGHGPVHDLTVIDFGATEVSDARQIRIVDDYRAIAMFHSNRGAEELRHGLYEEALKWLRTAVVIDPSHDASWVNMGVALRRSGDFAGAEQAYRAALEIDIHSTSALQNLASLLQHQGQTAEAMDLLELADRQRNRNPFTYLTLGDLNMRHGRSEVAGRYYRKALKREGQDAESMAALGLWHLRNGERKKASSWLRRAEHLDPQSGRVALLRSSLSGSDGNS